MSFANALDANRKIQAMFLPSGLLTNPMTVDLDMAGFNINGCENLDSTNVTTTTITVQDGESNNRVLSVGASPNYPLVVDGGLTALGTVGASVVTATGTVSSDLWASFPQFGIGSTVLWSNPATNVDILNTAAEAGLYLVTVSFSISKSGTSAPTAPITIQYINSSAQSIILAASTENDLEEVGYTNTYLYYQPIAGNITVQLDGGSLGAGESYTITSNGMGFIRLK
jgi:hypothetical protein